MPARTLHRYPARILPSIGPKGHERTYDTIKTQANKRQTAYKRSIKLDTATQKEGVIWSSIVSLKMCLNHNRQ